MTAVKKAQPVDFPKLLESWETAFPEEDHYLEGRPECALRWLLGMWLAKDPEGFLKVVTGGDFNYAYWAAQVMVRMMPGKAVELISGPGHEALNEDFAESLMRALAEEYPAYYLRLNPDGTFEVDPGHHSSGYDDWKTAIGKLAKTDPMAAANACLRWKGLNAPSTISEALQGVAEAWKPGDPPMTEWIQGIADPQLRNFATHARLCALAEKDPHAALAELYSVKLEDAERIDAPFEILKQLAKADLIGALKLMKDVEGFFSQHEWGIFAESSAEEDVRKAANPFSRLSPNFSEDPEDNSVRFAVLSTAAENLPDDPSQFFGALHQLAAAMDDADNPWQRRVEAGLIRLKSKQWSADTCLTVAAMWASEMKGARDDPTMRELAARAVHLDLEQSLAALDQLPESAQPSFAAELIKQLPATNPEQRIELIPYLSESQWDEKLGEALGAHGGDYAAALASLPVATTLGARRAFMEKWGEQDPEAAADWLDSLPDDAAAKPAAAGLAAAWADFDDEAAADWADSLPDGPTRDGAAASMAKFFARSDPEEAWRWASSIDDSSTRAEALTSVGYYWRSKAPEDFRAEMSKARQAAGLPDWNFMFDPPAPPDINNPFRE